MVALQLLQRKGCLPRGKSACSSRVLPSTLCKHENRVSLRPRAAADGAFYPEALDASGYAMAVAEPESDEMSVADIKAALLDSFYGTERGLAARSEIRAEINELITLLEAKNPNRLQEEAMRMLDGTWKLVYTSNSELLAILALSRLPFVSIGDITQRIETVFNTVENKVSISVPLSRTSFSTTASFEVRTPKRLQVRFEKGVIQTPELLADLNVPESVNLLGQQVDLSPLQGVLQPVSQGLNGVISQVGSILSNSSDLSFPISTDSAQTWLLTTYQDEDTRITRGDGGSVFILTKDVPYSPSSMTSQQEAVAEAMML
eukprot:GHRR01003724.1.p1 GENE.GHRR01003724.1~~GHRR01003724.1.p1  ORF type:complete len:318 (+),score=88.65 GHRR01003724.1:83-1036(+)